MFQLIFPHTVNTLDNLDLLQNEPLLCNEHGDVFYYSINNKSFDRLGSDTIYTQKWGDKLFNENKLYILAGSDCALAINYILKNSCPKGSHYIFVETDKMFHTISHLYPEIQELDNITLCKLEDLVTSANQIGLPKYAYLDSVKVFPSLCVEELHDSTYAQFWNELQGLIQQTLWNYTTQFGSWTFIRSQLENMAENRVPAKFLNNSCRGKTAILLAGGPSLDQSLEWVIANRTKLLVVSVSRISKRLLDAKIVPDIVVTVDPHFGSFDVGKHFLEFPSQVLLLNSNHASPLLVGQWTGRSIYLNHNNPWDCQYDEDNISGVGPTVSNSALNFLLATGCKEIYLSGFDLCFSAEGFTHAKGSLERNFGALVGFSGQTVETYTGTQAQTDSSFFAAIQSLAGQAELAEKLNSKIFNVSEAAAKIPGIPYKPLSSIKLKNKECSFGDILNARLPEDNRKSRIQHYQYCLSVLKKAKTNLRDIMKLSQRALEHNKLLFTDRKNRYKHKIKMDKIEKKLNQNYGRYADLCKIFGMSTFVKTLRHEDSSNWSDKDIKDIGHQYYEAYYEGSNKLAKEINSSISRLETRIEEESEGPDMQRLSNQWSKDRQFLRANVWRNYSPSKSLNAEQQKIIDQYTIKHKSLLEQSEHKYTANIRQRSNLNGVWQKAYEYYLQKNRSSLIQLRESLATRNEELAPLYGMLCTALICELEDNIETAVNLYKDIISKGRFPIVTEQAYCRLSNLHLGQTDLDSALSVLKELSLYSDSYTPQYADLLRMCNRLQESIDTYTDYLERVPNDVSTMFKLGLLYNELNIQEGALIIFKYLNKLNPENEAVQNILFNLEKSA